MEGISHKYLETAFNNLFSSVGTKEAVASEEIYLPLRQGKIKESVEKIANYFGLPINVNLLKVSESYSSNSSRGSKFTSSHLVKVNSKTGRGAESISAQVLIPSYIPLFGTPSLNSFSVDVKISKNIINYPETFSAIMAHELAHFFLSSMHHKEKENEIYTDITAMLLGFKDIVKDGRKMTKTTGTTFDLEGTTTHYQTTTYGYLSDNQFNFVFQKISRKLEQNRHAKRKIIKEIGLSRKKLNNLMRCFSQFKYFMKLIVKNSRKKISQEDGKKITLMHQPGYVEESEILIKKNKERIRTLEKCLPKKHYSENWDLKKMKEIEDIISTINKERQKIKNDIKTLKKNIAFIPRVKANIMFLTMNFNK